MSVLPCLVMPKSTYVFYRRHADPTQLMAPNPISMGKPVIVLDCVQYTTAASHMRWRLMQLIDGEFVVSYFSSSQIKAIFDIDLADI